VVTTVVAKPAEMKQQAILPGRLEPYEQTPLYAKVSGYVSKVNRDIGDQVKQGDLLAVIDVPELTTEVHEKEALIEQAKAEVLQASETCQAAKAATASAAAKVRETAATRTRARAELDRASSQFVRLTQAGKQGVIDQEAIDEAKYQQAAAEATVQEVDAKVQAIEAALQEVQAREAKFRADLGVARAKQRVAEAQYAQVQTLITYTRITAPFAGIVTQRGIDIGHFVGTAAQGGKATPLFTVVRIDKLRVRVEASEADAAWITTDATMLVSLPAQDRSFSAKVSRTSYALDRTARTLVVEADIANGEGQWRPGFYVSARLAATHRVKYAVPPAALRTRGEVTSGFETYTYTIRNGALKQLVVDVGLKSADLVELRRYREAGDATWREWNPQEQLVLSPPSGARDGQRVEIKR